ncbi:MAG: ABC transporter permease, partial [bacterium]
VCTAVVNSLQIGLISTILATILGTMIAFAIGRHKFKGRSSTNLLIFLPMATPEVVLGASLLAMFLNLRINPGFWTIVIAHVMFCISFVVVTVKARIASLDPKLEQAAMDLY